MATVADRVDSGVSIGRIFSRAFGTIAGNPGVTIGLAFLFGALPGVGLAALMSMALPSEGQGGSFGTVSALSLIMLSIASIAVAALPQAALTRAIVDHSQGRRVHFGDSIAAALGVIFHLIVLTLLITLAVILGLLFFIVPGLIFYCAWAVALPVMTEEKPGIMGALSRSRELTRGHRWKVFGASLLMFLIAAAINALGTRVGLASADSVARDPAVILSTAALLSSAAISTITTVIWGAMNASMYVELRQAKEGPANAQLEDVFA